MLEFLFKYQTSFPPWNPFTRKFPLKETSTIYTLQLIQIILRHFSFSKDIKRFPLQFEDLFHPANAGSSRLERVASRKYVCARARACESGRGGVVILITVRQL